MVANGQKFLFRPNPDKPPIYVGGQAPHALRRAVQYGDGWAVPSGEPDDLREPVAELRRLFEDAGKPTPEILVQLKTPANGLDTLELSGRINALAEIGATRISLGASYETTDEFCNLTEIATQLIDHG